MSLNQLDFGHAVKVQVISPITGTLITLTNVTEFESNQNVKAIESAPLNAPPIFADVPHGWRGKIRFDRVDASIDTFFSSLEAAYWANAQTFSGAIFYYILELDGTTSQFNFTGVTFTYTDAGKIKSQDKIMVELDFRASTRPKIQ